jgi:hypothetical protein
MQLQKYHQKRRISTERPHILARQAAASMGAASDLLKIAAGRTFNAHSHYLLRLAELAGDAGAHIRRVSRQMEAH